MVAVPTEERKELASRNCPLHRRNAEYKQWLEELPNELPKARVINKEFKKQIDNIFSINYACAFMLMISKLSLFNVIEKISKDLRAKVVYKCICGDSYVSETTRHTYTPCHTGA